MKKLILLLAILFGFKVCYSQAGALDPSFGNKGIVHTDFGASITAVQSDGKIVVAGSSFYYDNDTSYFVLARYNTDGTFDTTFSHDGKLSEKFKSAFSQANSLAIQSDGKIVVAGFSAVNV